MMMPMGWLWLVLLIAGGVLLWRVLSNRNQQDMGAVAKEPVQQESAHDILLKELAKGSITEEEYLAKKKYMDN